MTTYKVRMEHELGMFWLVIHKDRPCWADDVDLATSFTLGEAEAEVAAFKRRQSNPEWFPRVKIIPFK